MLNSCKVRRNTRTREIDQVVIDRPFTDERANVIYNYYRSIGIPIHLGAQAMQQELIRRGYNLDFQIIGERGVSNLTDSVQRIVSLSNAKKLKEQGKNDKDIWIATGWQFDTVDQKWKTEIADEIVNPLLDLEGVQTKIQEFQGRDITIPLNIIYSAQVFEAYPQLNDIQLIFSNRLEGLAATTKGENFIVLNPNTTLEELQKTLLHELHHKISEYEGFSEGSSFNRIYSEYLSDFIGYGGTRVLTESLHQEILTRANRDYFYSNGEFGARTAEDRSDLSTEERRLTPLFDDVDEDSRRYITNVLPTLQNPLDFLSTSKGEIYGFVTPEGEMFLDPEVAGVNTLIHEGAHIQYKVLKTAAERGDVKAQAVLTKIQELTNPVVETIFNAKKAQERGSDSMSSVDMQAEQSITKKMPELTELADKNIQIIKDYDRYQRILQKQSEGRRVLKADQAFLEAHPEFKNTPILDFGTPSDILKSVGITNPIKISMSHIERKLVGKGAHELTLLDLQDLMRAIHNPATVNKGAKGRVQLLTNHTNSDGAPIVVVIDNNYKSNTASITTAYTLNNLAKVVPETPQDVLYTNNKKLADFLSDYSESKNRGFGIALFAYPEYDSSTGTIKYTQEKTNPEIEFDTANIRKIIENTKNIINKTNVSRVDFQVQEGEMSPIFDSEGNLNIEELNRIVENNLITTNLTENEKEGLRRASKYALGLFIISREAEKKRATDGQELVGETTRRAIEDYSRAQQKIWSQERINQNYDYFSEGSEAVVYKSKDGTHVLKQKNVEEIELTYTPTDFIKNRVILYNTLFPDSTYEIVGITEQGDFLLKQDFVEGKTLTELFLDEEIQTREEVLEIIDKEVKRRFEVEREDRGVYFTKDYIIADISEYNIVQTTDGRFIIDAITVTNNQNRVPLSIEIEQDLDFQIIGEQTTQERTTISPEVLSSPAYNQRENETDEQYKERLREEVFARALGDNAEQYLKDLGFTTQEAKTFLQKVQEFLAEIVDWLRGKKGFQDLSVDEINRLSIREFLDRSTTSMMLGEFRGNVLGQAETPTQDSFYRDSDFNLDGTVKESVLQEIAEERRQIEEEAKVNGTWMKALNGNPTNLNEEQWVTVRTSRFKDWFGDWENDSQNASKVVDENGEPMVVYHGTNAEFHVFEPRVGIRGNQFTGPREVESEVFFFTANKEFAMKAAHARRENFGGKSNIKEVFLNIRKPLDFSEYRYETEEIFKDFVGEYPHEHFGDIDNLDQWWTLFDNDADDITSKVKEEGYEGVILAETTKEDRIDDHYSETVADIKSFGVFNPNQIKSATDNVGTFSSESNNINFQITGEQKAFNEGVEAVAKLANEYKKEFGIISVQHNKVNKLFPAVSRMVSEAYEQAETGMTTEEVREAYKALEEETLQQYKFIVDKGLKVSRWTGEGEPYPNSKSMLKDVRENNHLYFLPNSEAFGKEGDEVEGRAGLKLTDVYLDDGYRMTLSEVFRVVHDYFGHGILGNQFGAVGEENATLQHLDLYSFKALPAVIFQTRGQNSWVNFSGVNDEALRKIREGSKTNNKNLLEQGQKEFVFAVPKDNILPKIFNFKTYETARRINEQEEIRKSEAYLDPRGKNEDTNISELLTRHTSRNSGKLNGFSRRSLGVSKRLGGYDVDVIAEYEGNQEVERLIKNVFPEFKGTQKIYEISNGEVYRELMIKALETNKFKSSVTVHSAEDFSNMRLFVTEDGSTGITLTKDGFLGGAFGNPKADRPNNLAQMMLLGIKEGAITAEAFDTVLPNYYSIFGFKAVSRTAFNEEYRPLKENGALEDWDYELYSKFNNGRPDVVFFIYDGGDRGSIQSRLGQFDSYSNYQKDFTEYYDKDSYDDAYRFMEVEAINKNNYQNQEVNSQTTEEQGAQNLDQESKEVKNSPVKTSISKSENPSFDSMLDFSTIGGVLEIGRIEGRDIYSILYLKVDESYRRQGVASKLLKEALNKTNGNLSGQASNDAAVELNYKLGMRAYKNEKELSLEESKTERAKSGGESIRMILPESMRGENYKPFATNTSEIEQIKSATDNVGTQALDIAEQLLTTDIYGTQEYVPANSIITYYSEIGEINYKRNSEGDLVMLKTVSVTPQQEESITYQQLLSIPNLSKEQALEAYKNLYSTKFYNWSNKTNEC